ncbi:N-acetyltransferase [Streptomyces sp. NPDC002886]|uniref:N-acetyltransferase n=1 Tax=Streptomyces sp. NPDC002886 TaxID=3364667 RepID=UPI0036A72068
MVHVRKVVGQIHYRTCATCGEGVITGIEIDDHLLPTGIGTRALSHLHSRHPGIIWRSTLTLRTTRDLLRRMRVPVTTAGALCPHAPAQAAAVQGP